MRVRRSVVAAVLAMSSLIACSPAAPAPSAAPAPVTSTATATTSLAQIEPPQIEKVLTVAMTPSSLVPADAMENSTIALLMAIFSPLLELSGDGTLTPLAAADLPTTTDARTWTIPLAPGWTFHDGEPVTGRSFVDGWNFAATAAPYSGGYELRQIAGYEEVLAGAATALSGLRLVDPMTIEVTLAEPDSTFPVKLSHVVFAPMSAHCLADPAGCETLPVGNGPFRVVERSVDGQGLSLERYDEWRGSASAQVDRIEVVPTMTDEDIVGQVGSGQLDLASVLSGSELVAAAGNVAVTSVPSAVSKSLIFSPGDERLLDPKIRTAISLAIDREAVAAAAAGGFRGVPAHGLTPPNVAGHSPDACGRACEYDPVAARAQLEAAGGLAGPVSLTYSGGYGDEEAFRLLAAQLETNLGIDIELIPVESGELTFGVSGAGLIEDGWGAGAPVAAELVARWSGELGRDLGYSSEVVDDLMARAASAPSLDAGLQLVQQAEAQVLADFPAAPLWFSSHHWVHSIRLVGFETSGWGAPRWELLDVTGPVMR